MHNFYRGPFFNFEAIRILGTTRYGGAEIAECLEAIGNIRENDPESWRKAWAEQAQNAEKLAHEAENSGQRRAARDAFLRASNYTRASAYMMTGEDIGRSDKRVASILHKATDIFRMALPFFDGAVHVLEIPYAAGLSLPAYLYLPPPSCRLPGKIPIVINCMGADSTQEEQFFMFPAAGPELGYAVLSFEGPGQGVTLHEHGVPMRPDWEAVTGTVLDYLFQYSERHSDLGLDLDRVAIAGAALGGYFALRSAADSRCKACVAIDPVYDLWDFAAKHSGPTFFQLWKQGWIPDRFMNAVILLGTNFSFQMRWEIYTSARFLGVSSPVGILRAMQKFTFRQAKESYLSDIQCPVLVTGGADSLYFDVDDHTTMVLNELQTPEKEVWVGSSPGQGSLQAKMGAIGLCNQRTFEFLDRQFHIKRDKSPSLPSGS